MQEQYEDAIREAGYALEASPNYKGAFLRRSKAYELNKDFDRAIADLESALKVYPQP